MKKILLVATLTLAACNAANLKSGAKKISPEQVDNTEPQPARVDSGNSSAAQPATVNNGNKETNTVVDPKAPGVAPTDSGQPPVPAPTIRRCELNSSSTIGFEDGRIERFATINIPVDAANISFDIYDWHRNTNHGAAVGSQTAYMSTLVIDGRQVGVQFEQIAEHTPKGDVGSGFTKGKANKVSLDPNGACSASGIDCTRVTIFYRGGYDTAGACL